MMGKYTAWDDARVDEIIQDHLDQIVKAVLERVHPEAILLRGSFSQGEGSVIPQDGKLVFLSDYELIALTPRYQDRRWLRSVAGTMTRRLGVETSISRVHPQNIEHNSLGNTPIHGIARPTIAMYEIQQGGRTLYGADYSVRGPAIDPAQLDPWTGVRLLFNRMAESLSQLPRLEKDSDGLRWVNKTLLACAEAILLLHGEYHHSYAERQRRFARLAPRLKSIGDRAPRLPDLVQRATAFKLCPNYDLYPEPLPVLWQEVRQACDATVRHLAEEYLHITFENYAEFPARYLEALRGPNKQPALTHLQQNAWLAARLLRSRRLPPLALGTHLTYPAYQTVYSVIPLVFLECTPDTLAETKRRLGQVGYLKPQRRNTSFEWEEVRTGAWRAWQDLCYGMWDTLEV